MFMISNLLIRLQTLRSRGNRRNVTRHNQQSIPRKLRENNADDIHLLISFIKKEHFNFGTKNTDESQTNKEIRIGKMELKLKTYFKPSKTNQCISKLNNY